MKKTILILTALLLLGSCADSQTVSECVTGSSYGFWGGLWHGMISGISFIAKAFSFRKCDVTFTLFQNRPR